MERWTDGIAKEFQLLKDTLPESAVFSTVYFGGGTPSLLPLSVWSRLRELFAGVQLAPGCEFTVEANPDSLERSALDLWKSMGVNRVSLGIQSLNDAELKMMARGHTAAEALMALDMSISAGFRVSADLIFGLPGQTLRRWHENMSELLKAGVQHISIYQLTIEPDTFWGRHTPCLPDGYGMYRWAQYYLPLKGLKQYEIASFAVPGHESRHNTAYWTRGNVCALGPAAWGFRDGCRTGNIKDFDMWLSAVERGERPIDYSESLCSAEEASEAAVLALRTSRGICFERFSSRYGTRWLDAICARLRKMPPQDIEWRPDGVALTPRGMRVGNSIWSELMDLNTEGTEQ